MKSLSSRGQIEVTFNWIYILIAGALILLFFTGIIFRQQNIAEERLAGNVLQILETIFTGASVSDKTKHAIDTSGLSDYIFTFTCDSNEGVGEYGLKGKGIRVQDSTTPLFAPAELQAAQLLTWSLPFSLPFKVTDFLMVTAPSVRYYLYGSALPSGDQFMEELAEETATWGNFLTDVSYNDIPAFAGQIRIVATEESGMVDDDRPIPLLLQDLPDETISAVVFNTENTVSFYKNINNQWKFESTVPLLVIPNTDSHSSIEAAKVAAVFASSAESYSCNMQKALRRLELQIPVYQQKLEEMFLHHQIINPLCQVHLKEEAAPAGQETLEAQLTLLANVLSSSSSCKNQDLLAGCLDLITPAKEIKRLNEHPSLNCITLY